MTHTFKILPTTFHAPLTTFTGSVPLTHGTCQDETIPTTSIVHESQFNPIGVRDLLVYEYCLLVWELLTNASLTVAYCSVFGTSILLQQTQTFICGFLCICVCVCVLCGLTVDALSEDPLNVNRWPSSIFREHLLGLTPIINNAVCQQCVGRIVGRYL